jgi:Bacterial Ig-like domain (group 2).
MYETVTAVTDEQTSKALVEKLRATYTKMQLPSTKYNAWNKVKGDGLALEVWSDPEDIVVMITADLDAKLSVRDWAYAFGESYAQILGRKVVVDDFNEYDKDGNLVFDGSGIQAVIADAGWFKIKTQDFAMDEFFNASARAWTYFLNITKMINYSVFHNCLVLCTESAVPEVDATAITAVSDTASVAVGAKVTVPFTITPPNATTTVTATSSAEGKATVAVKGKAVEITGVEAGSATITISAGAGVTDTIAVTVTGE